MFLAAHATFDLRQVIPVQSIRKDISLIIEVAKVNHATFAFIAAALIAAATIAGVSAGICGHIGSEITSFASVSATGNIPGLNPNPENAC